MKKSILVKSSVLILYFVLFFNYVKAFCQVIFPQNIYSVNQDIIVYGTELVTSIENGISGSSQDVSMGTGNINLGSNSQPGLYLVSFILANNSRQTYLIAIGDNTTNFENSVIDFSNSTEIPNEQKIFLADV